jgi:hypothetical protein
MTALAKLKADLEDPDIATVVVSEDITYSLMELYNAGYYTANNDDVININGNKTLTLNADVTITNNNVSLPYLRSFIRVPSGASLNINGTGSLSCDFHSTAGINAVILNSWVLNVTGVTINGTSTPGNCWAQAISNAGTATINSGTFTGVSNLSSPNAEAAVSSGGSSSSTTINGGTFIMTTRLGTAPDMAGLDARSGTFVLNGGSYQQGINGGARNISTFLGSGRNTYNAATGSTTVPNNVTRISVPVWVR